MRHKKSRKSELFTMTFMAKNDARSTHIPHDDAINVRKNVLKVRKTPTFDEKVGVFRWWR